MARILEIDDVTWRGMAGHTVRGNLLPAEPDVGIMGPGLECLELIGPTGLPVELDAEAEQELAEQLQPHVEAYYYGGED